MKVNLTWGKSLSNFTSKVDRVEKNVRRDVEKTVDRTGEDVKRIAESNTPVLTGKLLAGWKTIVSGRGGSRNKTVVNDVEYASFVENGTRGRAPRKMLARAEIKGEKLLMKRLRRSLDKAKRTFE